MNCLEDLLNDQLPTAEDQNKLQSIATGLIREIGLICKTEKIDANAVEVGSTSKNTNLKSSDIDIFITFSKSYPVALIEKKGLEIGHRILKNGTEKYAEHPYVSGYVDGVKVDVVPAFRIKEGERIVSTVDRTPLHTIYVNSRTNNKMVHDIRLLKIFLKKINVYGSEIAKSGFSGYLCELAIISFGSFDKFMEYSAKLKGKMIIPENCKTKFNEPVIIIDPVDPTRNAGAAVSEENLSKLKLAAKLYTSNRCDILFDTVPEVHHNRETTIKVFTVKKPDIIDDIIYPQAVRLKKKIFDILERSGFMPVSFELYVGNDIEILIEYLIEKLPDVKKHMGPPVESCESIKFIDSWRGNKRLMRGPYIIGQRIYVDARIMHTEMEQIVRDELTQEDIGKNLNSLKNDIKVLSGDKINDLQVTKNFYSKYLF
ncbi:CCA tRNA nucleotidyltransferase [Ferroplasma sp.]|uniref:CCA tRNA nucleotidyltransferase n=1 Tax=Ferroplasma sp. TaxID=2591003 RepID=UPI00307CF94F